FVSALRSEDPVADVPRTAEGCMARAARRMEGATLCVESRLRWRLRPSRALHRRSGPPDSRGHCGLAGAIGPHSCRRVLGLVRALVALAVDPGRTRFACRMGARL